MGHFVVIVGLIKMRPAMSKLNINAEKAMSNRTRTHHIAPPLFQGDIHPSLISVLDFGENASICLGFFLAFAENEAMHVFLLILEITRSVEPGQVHVAAAPTKRPNVFRMIATVGDRLIRVSSKTVTVKSSQRPLTF